MVSILPFLMRSFAHAASRITLLFGDALIEVGLSSKRWGWRRLRYDGTPMRPVHVVNAPPAETERRMSVTPDLVIRQLKNEGWEYDPIHDSLQNPTTKVKLSMSSIEAHPDTIADILLMTSVPTIVHDNNAVGSLRSVGIRPPPNQFQIPQPA